MVGEIPRLVFLTRFQLHGLVLPDDFGPGPGFGVACIRERFGGKTPEGLGRYRRAIRSDDYMMIVASWVDGHAQRPRRRGRALPQGGGRQQPLIR